MVDEGVMGVLETVRNRLGGESGTRYECRNCGVTTGRTAEQCPNCGSTEIAQYEF
ncbi:hypothetical protein [Natrinema salaciae]|uniref:hypothetical protein n=1 Tax=Natrinema salaciae TaxID=1186196 RepID=UPI0015873A3C|nr:hypothetical protein [Natrinema salaciae]